MVSVGGLLLLLIVRGSCPQPELPIEDQVIAQTTCTIQILYNQIKRRQDSATVVANLLTNVDHPTIHPGQ
jgi:hypothetical protein